MFKGRERAASMVVRWSTTPRIRDQHLSDHSFYVALYTDFLCQLLGWPKVRRYEAVHWALIHDMPETVLSDTPGPVKRRVMDRGAFKAAEESIYIELGSGYEHDITDGYVRAVVKAANLIDEVFYLHMERMLGNQFLDRVFVNSWTRMVKELKLLTLVGIPDIIKQELDEMTKGVVSLIGKEDPHA